MQCRRLQLVHLRLKLDGAPATAHVLAVLRLHPLCDGLETEAPLRPLRLVAEHLLLQRGRAGQEVVPDLAQFRPQPNELVLSRCRLLARGRQLRVHEGEAGLPSRHHRLELVAPLDGGHCRPRRQLVLSQQVLLPLDQRGDLLLLVIQASRKLPVLGLNAVYQLQHAFHL